MSTYDAYRIEGDNRPAKIVVICDHATNTVPDFVNAGDLGLPGTDMARHIAYDVGALGLSQRLAQLLDAPMIYSNFSRLVIDPNRGEDDPTLVMQLYDGSIIPANRNISEEDKELRQKRCYRPYHTALQELLAARDNPIVISIHSFTKQLNGYSPRPWHVGILYAEDQRLSKPLIDVLSTQSDLCVGDNQPYKGNLKGDTMEYHALRAQRIHALIEVRNDLIETKADQHKWADRIAPLLTQAIKHTQTNETKNGRTNTS